MANHRPPPRTSHQRIRARLTYLRDLLEAIDDRSHRANQSTTTAPQYGTQQRTQTSGYADPTHLTASARNDTLGNVETDLWNAITILERAASRLRAWAPNPPPDDRCDCPPDCCPNGCNRPRTDGRDEHPTCRSKRARARTRGETWATQ